MSNVFLRVGYKFTLNLKSTVDHKSTCLFTNQHNTQQLQHWWRHWRHRPIREQLPTTSFPDDAITVNVHGDDGVVIPLDLGGFEHHVDGTDVLEGVDLRRQVFKDGLAHNRPIRIFLHQIFKTAVVLRGGDSLDHQVGLPTWLGWGRFEALYIVIIIIITIITMMIIIIIIIIIIIMMIIIIIIIIG